MSDVLLICLFTAHVCEYFAAATVHCYLEHNRMLQRKKRVPAGEVKHRSLIVAVLKMMATGILTAAVAWRLAAIGLKPETFDTLILLGVPLISFFLCGVVLITAVAWVNGVLAAWFTLCIKIGGRQTIAVVSILGALAVILCSIEFPTFSLIQGAAALGAIVVCALSKVHESSG